MKESRYLSSHPRFQKSRGITHTLIHAPSSGAQLLLFFSALSQKPSLQKAQAMLKCSLMQMVGASSDSDQHIYSQEKGKKWTCR